jgi:membrane protein YdbS with pleckstrin-like domain
MVVPLGKITNTRTIRNVFSYLLFKAGSLQVFTGGSDDPYLRLFREYEDYSEIVSQKYGTVRQRIKDATNDSQKATYEEYRPGMSYLVNTLFTNLIFWGIVGGMLAIVIYLVPEIPVWLMGIVVGAVIFWLLAVLMIRIWQRSVTRYYLYENKLVIRYGIITLRSEELYYRNIKYLKLTRPYLFTRLLDEGTIHLYTAGTGGVDNRVSSIKAYKKVYEYLRGKVLEE